MGTFVLVHGAWFGSWCWERVAPLLAERGHRVLTPDLPGYGPDRTPPREITLQTYVDRVCRAVDDEPEPVVLVGHSRAGVIITQAAEARPDRIEGLVYVCAFLPRTGESLLSLVQQSANADSRIFPEITIAEELGHIEFTGDAAAVRAVFMHDRTDEDAARAKARLAFDALAPSATPVHVSEAGFGRLPRTYVECLQDRVITPALQRQMYTATPCERVVTLDTSHSPFYAAPESLAHCLVDAAAVPV